MKRLPAVSAAVLLASAWCGAAGLFRVSGVIVNAETGEPLPRALLALQKVGTTTIVASQVCGNDGRFAFDVPQGKYTLQGGTRAAVERYGRRMADAQAGTSIITGPGQDTTGLTFRWFPIGSISGTVTDDSGEPVEGALIQLVRSVVVAGERVTSTFGWDRTDDRGEYRFGRLVASTYYLVASGKPWYSGSFAAAPGADLGTIAYRPVYFPNSLDKTGAAPVVLKSGEERRADFVLHAVPGARLKLTYEDAAPLTGTVSLLNEGIGVSDGFERQERLQSHSQTLAGVPPGHYRLRVAGMRGKDPVIAVQNVDVVGGDVEVKVALLPVPTVSGSIRMKSADMKPRGAVVVQLINTATRASTPLGMRPDGTFVYGAILPGKFRPLLHGTDGYFASEIRVEGADFHDGVVEIVPGRSAILRIVASDETGRVQGFVMRGERAVEGMWVILAPAEDPATPALGFQTDSDGSFDYPDVPAGDYFLFAVEPSDLEYGNREVIRPYFAAAQRIHVAAHQSLSERIPVSAPAGK